MYDHVFLNKQHLAMDMKYILFIFNLKKVLSYLRNYVVTVVNIGCELCCQCFIMLCFLDKSGFTPAIYSEMLDGINGFGTDLA